MHDNPLHIAIIPDGNRRWAKGQDLSPWKGHEKAVENFRSLTTWCRESPDVNTLTVWCFSTENWKRDSKEISKLMTMLEEYLRKEHKGFIKNKTRFIHSGRRDRIPASLTSLIEDIEKETAGQTEFTLHLAVDYGGKDEIERAVTHAREAQDTDFTKYFDHPELPDIDLIIRTSGEKRTSNFFLWQSTYSEWDFVEKYFPDFKEKDLKKSVEDFLERTRRFGE